MRLTPIERLLKNLKKEIPSYMRREFLPKDVAYEKLRQVTGHDFGDDIEKWEEWIREQVAAGVEFHFSKADPSMTRTRVQVIEATQAGDRDVVVGWLERGEIATDMVLESEGSRDCWRILGVSFTPVDARQNGLRGMSLERVGHDNPIRSGQILHSADGGNDQG
jgi:hypothetical protein